MFFTNVNFNMLIYYLNRFYSDIMMNIFFGDEDMYNAHEIASYVINWCHRHKISITNLKLQKLLYFIQGENCRIRHTRFISDDFYAWQLGPVIPKVYYEFAIYSSYVIPKQKCSISFSSDELFIIDQTLLKYASKSTWNLVDISHSQDPWKYNYQVFGDRSLIPYKSIENYYESGERL